MKAGVPGGAATSLRTAAPTSAGSQRAPLSMTVPWRHPSAIDTLPPSTSNTLPVTPALSADPSQATSGATFSGAMASKLPSAGTAIISAKGPSVMRVRAAGAMAFAVTP